MRAPRRFFALFVVKKKDPKKGRKGLLRSNHHPQKDDAHRRLAFVYLDRREQPGPNKYERRERER